MYFDLFFFFFLNTLRLQCAPCSNNVIFQTHKTKKQPHYRLTCTPNYKNVLFEHGTHRQSFKEMAKTSQTLSLTWSSRYIPDYKCTVAYLEQLKTYIFTS